MKTFRKIKKWTRKIYPASSIEGLFEIKIREVRSVTEGLPGLPGTATVCGEQVHSGAEPGRALAQQARPGSTRRGARLRGAGSCPAGR